jgi:hypothetical protein
MLTPTQRHGYCVKHSNLTDVIPKTKKHYCYLAGLLVIGFVIIIHDQ